MSSGILVFGSGSVSACRIHSNLPSCLNTGILTMEILCWYTKFRRFLGLSLRSCSCIVVYIDVKSGVTKWTSDFSLSCVASVRYCLWFLGVVHDPRLRSIFFYDYVLDSGIQSATPAH